MSRTGWSRDPSNEPSTSAAEEGASLVEVMLGMVVLVVAFLGIIDTTMYTSNQRVGSEEMRHAYAACHDNIEQIRSLPISAVAALAGTGFDVPGPNNTMGYLPPIAGDPDGLPGLIQVTIEGQTPSATIYRVVLAVDWAGRRGDRQLRFQALVGDR